MYRLKGHGAGLLVHWPEHGQSTTEMNSLPLLTPAEATHLHTQLSGPMAQFHLSINCSKTCMPEMMIDIGIFCRGQEGNFRDASYQSCQIWLLPEGADFPSSPFFKSQSKCLTGGELCQGADSTEMERQDIETWAGLCGEH